MLCGKILNCTGFLQCKQEPEILYTEITCSTTSEKIAVQEVFYIHQVAVKRKQHKHTILINNK